jgi:glycosyltransferase involved in cell wall biosynthesis
VLIKKENVTKNKYILVGAKKPNSALQKETFGGVLTLSNSIVEYADSAGFDIVIIDTLKKPFLQKSFFQEIKNGAGRVAQLITLLREEKCNGVIIFSGAGLGFYERILLSAICRVTGVPCLIFIVDGWFLSVRNKFFLKRWWIGLLLKIPNTLAASGANWLSFFLSMGVKKNHLVSIHYWLPKSFRTALKPKVLAPYESINFIFIGWMIKEKGLNEILAVLTALYDEYRFNFTFIGGGSMLGSVREIIRNSKWDSRVFARGWLTLEKKEEELSSAHVFVLPSYAEGFPMSLIEAMLSGLPAICSDVGGISDSLHDGVNGFLIPPKNIQALKEAMEFYIKNPDALSKHSLESMKLVRKNHDVERNCNALFNVFEGG